jgi:hypothetical protein
VLSLFSAVLVFGSRARAGDGNKWLWWGLLQTIPSPVLVQDSGPDASRAIGALRWQVVPINISMNANPFVSPAEAFCVNTVRRYGGSAEIFLQPEWALTGFQNADLGRFSAGAGVRVILPLIEDGEYLACSIGDKHMFRWTTSNVADGSNAVEFGMYTLLGMAGIQASFDTSDKSRTSVAFTLRYF